MQILASGYKMYAMIKTLNKNIGLWSQNADDDDTCSNVNIGLWPQDVLTSLAKRAQERTREPKRAVFQ